MLKFASDTYGPRPYIGERAPIKDEKGAVVGLSNFKFLSFSEVRQGPAVESADRLFVLLDKTCQKSGRVCRL